MVISVLRSSLTEIFLPLVSSMQRDQERSDLHRSDVLLYAASPFFRATCASSNTFPF